MLRAFLAPLAEQQEALRADLRRSRGPTDITTDGTPVPAHGPVPLPISPG